MRRKRVSQVSRGRQTLTLCFVAALLASCETNIAPTSAQVDRIPKSGGLTPVVRFWKEHTLTCSDGARVGAMRRVLCVADQTAIGEGVLEVAIVGDETSLTSMEASVDLSMVAPPQRRDVTLGFLGVTVPEALSDRALVAGLKDWVHQHVGENRGPVDLGDLSVVLRSSPSSATLKVSGDGHP